MFSYQKLEVYNLSKEIVKETYKITSKFPKSEIYGLISQMNRAAISISSNIAEGSGRETNKDKAHFISMAYGSLMEVSCQIEITTEIGYVDKEIYEKYIKLCVNLSVKLNNYRKYLHKNDSKTTA